LKACLTLPCVRADHSEPDLTLERTDYFTGTKRIARTDPIQRIALLSLKLDNKDGGAILPLISDDPEAFKHSPFYSAMNPEDDPSSVAASLMGPGPWAFHHELRLPNSCTQLNFSNQNRRAYILITHNLKVIFRVERGDDEFVDQKSGKRKLFDIVVQTPVHILSVSNAKSNFPPSCSESVLPVLVSLQS
jgi:hypothetical protein